MAKSLRSKRRRKMRAEKRVVNAKKELVKLHKIADRLHGPKTMDLDADKLDQIPDTQVVELAPMSVDDGASSGTQGVKPARINNQWMNHRKIKSVKQKIKRHARKNARKPSSARISGRKGKRKR